MKKRRKVVLGIFLVMALMCLSLIPKNRINEARCQKWRETISQKEINYEYLESITNKTSDFECSWELYKLYEAIESHPLTDDNIMSKLASGLQWDGGHNMESELVLLVSKSPNSGEETQKIIMELIKTLSEEDKYRISQFMAQNPNLTNESIEYLKSIDVMSIFQKKLEHVSTESEIKSLVYDCYNFSLTDLYEENAIQMAKELVSIPNWDEYGFDAILVESPIGQIKKLIK